jgi:hypothetical protein
VEDVLAPVGVGHFKEIVGPAGDGGKAVVGSAPRIDRRIEAAPAGKEVAACTPFDLVIPVACKNCVVPVTRVDAVIAAVGKDIIVAAKGRDDVVSLKAKDHVIAAGPFDVVRSAGAKMELEKREGVRHLVDLRRR